MKRLQPEPRISWIASSLILLTILIVSHPALAQATNTFPENGNAGVGTTSPAVLMDLKGSNVSWGGQLRLLAPDYSQITFYNSSATALNATNRLGSMFYDVSNTRLYIDNHAGNKYLLLNYTSGGYVGIHTSAPQYKLDVQGAQGYVNVSSGFCINGDCKTAWSQVGAGGTITAVNANTGLTGGGTSGAVGLAVSYGSSTGTAVEGHKTLSLNTAGDSGLSGGNSITLGAGGSLTLTNTDKGSSQSIFKNIANSGGTTQFSAGSNTDSIRFAGSGGTSVSFDAATKKVTIDATNSTGSAANITAGQFGQNTGGGNYTFPGNLTVTGTVEGGNIKAKYQDVAEWVPSSQQLVAGTVVVLDSSKSNQVISSSQPYDTRVAGVISAQPGITLGESGEGKVLVATTGRVRVKVDATRAPIHVGDLLVTSDISGVAMKSEAVNLGGVQIHRPGTIIGKALEPLEKGSGTILVLLSLQ